MRPANSGDEGSVVALQLDALTLESLDKIARPEAGYVWVLKAEATAKLRVLQMEAAEINTLSADEYKHLDFRNILTQLDTQAKLKKLRDKLHGKWKCVGTHGMDEFLKAMNIGRLQRLAAKNAPWPSWEFAFDGNEVRFTNFSAMGEIRENITIGTPYTSVDGWKREINCKAMWEEAVLVVIKTGPEGNFREERWVDEKTEQLRFKLSKLDTNQAPSGAEWGRTFERSDN